MAFNLPPNLNNLFNVPINDYAFSNNFGGLPNDFPNNFNNFGGPGGGGFNFQNANLDELNTILQGLKPQESGLEQIWREIREYKPSTAEKVAFAAIALTAVLKVADAVVNEMKLWKRNVREYKAAAAINQGHWDSGGVVGKVIQFFTPKSTQVDGYFQLDPKDARPKFLYLSAEEDDFNALDPTFVSQLLSSYDKDFDLKFSLVGSYDDICREIEEGRKTGKLINIIIDAHGATDGQSIELSVDPQDTSKKI